MLKEAARPSLVCKIRRDAIVRPFIEEFDKFHPASLPSFYLAALNLLVVLFFFFFRECCLSDFFFFHDSSLEVTEGRNFRL